VLKSQRRQNYMFATEEETAEINVEENEETSEESVQEIEQLVPETVLSELLEPRWSVITFEGCAVCGLSYDEAANWMKKLKNQGLSGLCIVTDEAAERISD
jgi:hypothetical protein